MTHIILFHLLKIILIISVGSIVTQVHIASATKISCADGPIVSGDSNLGLQPVFKGLRLPVAMTFIDHGDILLALKEQGTIHRIINGNILPDPLLDLEVANGFERGLLGLTASKNDSSGITYVFVFYTKSGGGKDGDDFKFDGENITRGIPPFGSLLERYELIDNKLINPKQLLYIKSTPNPIPDRPGDEMHHVGGKVTIGPDKNVYVITGDSINQKTQAHNYANGSAPNGTSGILRLSQDGQPVRPSPLGDDIPWVYYYAYGIRNGFGMDFDPVTGELWDSEPGHLNNDEINIVEPGFNSGWPKVQGFAEANYSSLGLVYPNGSGKYHDPVLVWKMPVTPTAIKFFNSDKLGPAYENDLFVARHNGGLVNQSYLYHFELGTNRSGILFNDSSLQDMVVNNQNEDDELAFAKCLGVITDIQVGPDGQLYLLEHMSGVRPGGLGTIYRLEKIW